MKATSPNSPQLEAINHLDGPLMVVAGAGTGKTFVITQRISSLIQKHSVKPEEILALTFTDKAAQEMEERVDKMLPLGVNSVNITTFNAFGNNVLQEFGIDIGLLSGMRIISRVQQIVLLRDNIDELGLDYFALKGNPSSLFSEWLDFFSSLRNELITTEAYKQYATDLKNQATTKESKLEAKKHLELATAYGVYSHLKQQKGLIDYDDQINLTISLLESRPNVASELRKRYKYILVDEFQDTNLAQNKLVELLAGRSGNVMVVGDDDQSIYKFRGAAISNILSFSERFQNVRRVILTENYRSSQEILDSAYKLIQHNNPDRLEAKYDITKRLTATFTGDFPQLVHQPNIQAEAAQIAELIKGQIKAGIDPTDIAVLVRKHKQLEWLVPALAKKGVPHSVNLSQKLYHRTEIQFLLSFLQFLVDPHSSEALFYLLQHPHFGFHQHELASYSSQAKALNEPLYAYLNDHLSAKSESHAKFIDFYQLMTEMREYSAANGVVETVYQFLLRSGYKEALEQKAENDPGMIVIFKNLEQFLQILTEFAAIADDKSARGYISSLGTLKDLWQVEGYQEQDFGQGQIKLMTIHQSKGLEFESVYIFDVNQTDFPGSTKSQNLKIPDSLLKDEVLPEGNWHIQEERRLMYVAATRAKKFLTLSYSENHNAPKLRKPSVFIKELVGEAFLEARMPEQLKFSIDRFEPAIPSEAPLHLQLINDEGKLRLTPHQIDDYDKCPFNFRHRYLLHVPESPSSLMAYGNLLHKIINQYYIWRRSGAIQLADLTAMVDQLWDSRGYDSKKQELSRRKQAVKTVEDFYKREEASGLLPLYTEERFEFEIPEADVIIRGRYDAIFEKPDGTIEIRDYKTGYVEESEKAETNAKKSIQLAIYALAWESRTGKRPDIVTLDYVNTGQIGSALKTPQQLEKLREKIIQIASDIRNEHFPPKGNHRFCAHRPIGSK